AIEPLRALVTDGDTTIKNIRPEIIKTLQVLGDDTQIDTIEVQLRKLSDLTSKPVKKHGSFSLLEEDELRTIAASLDMLEFWVKAGHPKAKQKRQALHAALDLFESQIPEWIAKNLSTSQIHGNR